MRNGFKVIARNWKCRVGELDLVVGNDTELRIVEVKTRMNQPGFAAPEEAVTHGKLHRMEETAALFLAAHPALPELLHFDVFTVRFAHEGEPVYQWLKDFE